MTADPINPPLRFVLIRDTDYSFRPVSREGLDALVKSAATWATTAPAVEEPNYEGNRHARRAARAIDRKTRRKK